MVVVVELAVSKAEKPLSSNRIVTVSHHFLTYFICIEVLTKNHLCFDSEGVFIARGKEDALVTRNFVPGSEVYGEKRISVEVIYRVFFFIISDIFILTSSQ